MIQEDTMKNKAARMIITILSLITVAAILLGLYINVFSIGLSTVRFGCIVTCTLTKMKIYVLYFQSGQAQKSKLK